MQWEYLEYLTKITPGVTIDALAESLHITRSGLSKSLTVLEREFNCPLIIRTRKGMYLTAEAEEIVRYTKEYFDKINVYRLTSRNLSGRIILPIASYSTRFFGADTISSFIKENPNVDIEIVNATAINIHHFLDDKDCEIALSIILHYDGNAYPCTYNFYNPKTATISYAEPLSKYTFVPCIVSKVCIECHKDLALALKNFSFADLGKKKVLLNTNADTFDESPMEYLLRNHFSLNYSFEPDRNLYFKMLQNKIGYGLSNYMESFANHLPGNLTKCFLKTILPSFMAI